MQVMKQPEMELSFEDKLKYVRLLSPYYHIIPKVTKRPLSDQEIVDIVTEVVTKDANITIDQVKSRSRKLGCPESRYRIFYLTNKLYPKIPLKFIGSQFGKKYDNAHCSVIAGKKEVEAKRDVVKKYRDEVDLLELRVLEKINEFNTNENEF